MKVAVIANEVIKDQLQSRGPAENDVSWFHELGRIEDVDAVVDLLFQPGPDRIEALEHTGARVVIVNFVSGSLGDLPKHFIRINGWPGFLSGEIIEASGANEESRTNAEKVFALFGKKVSWTPDQPGFVSPRVIAMIINEAFLTVEEGVSSREDIDTAMKLGTGYPYGPFEWAKMIGIAQVHELLIHLSKKNARYKPAALLSKEALS